ncbi:MAG: MSHA biogenesis protein MshG [Methylibium sp. NZG]|nr:MAG: MSHA biogenesis protein MshG [Methylibium sp. NZG]
MASFLYKGRDADRAAVSGQISGSSAAHAADALSARGIVPIAIELAPVVESAQVTLARLTGRKAVDTEQLLMLSRQLHTLLKAGVPLLRALQGLQNSSSDEGLRALLRDLLKSLDEGYDLSQAMARRGDVFDAFYVSMVRVGETTGGLPDIFLSLHQHMEFQRFMREQIASALRYPKFVIGAMVIAMIVINVMVIPAFAKVFANLNTELPLMTRILLGTSKAVLDWWPLMVGAVVGMVFTTKLWLRSSTGRLLWDRWKLHLPVAGKVVRKGALARACRALALALRSGVPVLPAVTLAAEVVDNAHLCNAIKGMVGCIERGESMLIASNRAGIFTPVVLQMVAVGEETGKLDDMLEEIGQVYQREVEYELKTMSQQIEPILILVLGAMVLVLALGVFMPMWDLGKAAIK